MEDMIVYAEKLSVSYYTPILALNYVYGETYESLFTIENQILIRSKAEGEFNSRQGQPYYKISLD